VREALTIQRKLSDNSSLDTATSLQYLGEILERQNRMPEAEAALREALAVRRKTQGTANAYLAALLSDLADVLRGQGKHAEAASLYQEELAIRRRIPGETDHNVGSALGNLARSLEAQGKLAEAEVAWREAAAVESRLSNDDQPTAALSLFQLARFLNEAGRLGEAEVVSREVLAIRRKSLGNEARLTGYALVTLGFNLLRQGKQAEAAALFRERIDRARAKDGEGWASTDPELGWVLHHYADALWNVKEFKKARPFAEDAWTLYQQHPDWPENERHHASQVLQAVLTALDDRSALESLQRDLLAQLPAQVAQLRKAAERGDPESLNNLAWLLATCPDSGLRDGKSAVAFAERAVAATLRKNVAYLDTLAAAYAETGQFAKAVSVQNEAIALLHDEKMKEDFASRLRLYQSNSPYRETGY